MSDTRRSVCPPDDKENIVSCFSPEYTKSTPHTKLQPGRYLAEDDVTGTTSDTRVPGKILGNSDLCIVKAISITFVNGWKGMEKEKGAVCKRVGRGPD